MKEKLIITIGAILLYGGGFIASGFVGTDSPWKIPAICYLSLIGIGIFWVLWREGKLPALFVTAMTILCYFGFLEKTTPLPYDDDEEVCIEEEGDWSDIARFERVGH